jgi:hypothetical protein
MTPEEQKDIIVMAVQAGKKETSGLVAEIMHKMEQGIELAINKNVNGKIKRLDEKIDAYIISDNEWKKEFEPYVKGLSNVTGGGKILVWVSGAVVSIWGAILLIREHIK